MAITVVNSASESMVTSGRAVTVTTTVTNTSSAAITCTIAPFDLQFGVGGDVTPASLAVPANGSASATWQRIFTFVENPNNGPETVTINCTVRGSDGSFAVGNAVNPLVYSQLDYTTPISPAYGELDFRLLYESSWFAVI